MFYNTFVVNDMRQSNFFGPDNNSIINWNVNNHNDHECQKTLRFNECPEPVLCTSKKYLKRKRSMPSILLMSFQ